MVSRVDLERRQVWLNTTPLGQQVVNQTASSNLQPTPDTPREPESQTQSQLPQKPLCRKPSDFKQWHDPYVNYKLQERFYQPKDPKESIGREFDLGDFQAEQTKSPFDICTQNTYKNLPRRNDGDFNGSIAS